MRALIDLAESAEPHFAYLYHGTTDRAYRAAKRGSAMRRGSYWTSKPDIALWFAQHKAKDNGGKPVVVRLPFAAFHADHFRPDLNIVDFAIAAHEHDFDARFDRLPDPKNITWQDTLCHYDAVIYDDFLNPFDMEVIK